MILLYCQILVVPLSYRYRYRYYSYSATLPVLPCGTGTGMRERPFETSRKWSFVHSTGTGWFDNPENLGESVPEKDERSHPERNA